MIYLKTLKLINFRCYQEVVLEFSPHLNILVGPNAAGKTTVVEAVHCLGFLKSHKAGIDAEMISYDQDFTVIKGNFEKEGKLQEVVFSLSAQGKRILANQKPFRQLSEYLGFLHVVFFCPEDLEIVKGAPGVRRKFLDSNLCLVSEAYMKSLIIYRKLLKQRNEVLKNINENHKYDRKLLEVLTGQMIPQAETLIKEREHFIRELNPLIEEKSLAISGGKEKVSLLYMPSNYTGTERDSFFDIKKDLNSKTTTSGPHRDDFEFLINGFKAAAFASQGQQRTAALSLKLALADYLNKKTEDIIIILDDVFSELDSERQNQILKLLNSEYQIFITTTSISNLSEEILKDNKTITVRREEYKNA
jgi:DNA replication and repair protein RecF